MKKSVRKGFLVIIIIFFAVALTTFSKWSIKENEVKCEAFRDRLANFLFIVDKVYNENAKYNCLLYYDNSTKIAEQFNTPEEKKELKKIKKEVNKVFSDEIITKLDIDSYDTSDLYSRGATIISIISYNYDYENEKIYNLDEIIELVEGTKMFKYRDIVNEIPIRQTNKYCIDNYGISYAKIIKNDFYSYTNMCEKIQELYDKVLKEDEALCERLFSILKEGSCYHPLYTLGYYKIVPKEELDEDLKARECVTVVYNKYNQIMQEYEINEDTQKFLDCTTQEEKYKKKLYLYNRKNPKLINKICEEVEKNKIKTFTAKKLGQYITSTTEFQKLIDETLFGKRASLIRSPFSM